jgi:hypothetical protein
VCLLSWVGASEKVALKYASIYRKCGMDVLLQLTRPLHVICPVSHGRADSAALVDALRSSEARGRPLAVAAFSAGGYMLGNALLELRDGVPLGGEDVLSRLRGVVLDSPVDFDGIPFGLSRAMTGSAEGTPAQRALEMALNAYLYGPLRGVVTVHYEASSSIFKAAGERIPGWPRSLWIYSDADTVVEPRTCAELAARWRSAAAQQQHSGGGGGGGGGGGSGGGPDGAEGDGGSAASWVREEEFSGTKHVSHLAGDGARYEAAVVGFLRDAGLSSDVGQTEQCLRTLGDSSVHSCAKDSTTCMSLRF